MYLYIIFISLCLFGVGDVIYILYKNRPTKQLVCPLNSDCSAVLGGKWNKFLGVKNEYWGLSYYLSLLVVVGLFLSSVNFIFDWKLVLLLMTGFGVLYSIFLTIVQIIKIKEYCFYCLVSAGLSVLLFITSIFIYV